MLVPRNSFSGSSISGVTALNEALESHWAAGIGDQALPGWQGPHWMELSSLSEAVQGSPVNSWLPKDIPLPGLGGPQGPAFTPLHPTRSLSLGRPTDPVCPLLWCHDAGMYWTMGNHDRDLGPSTLGITRDRDGCWESNMVRAKMMEASNERSPSASSLYNSTHSFYNQRTEAPGGWGYHWEPQKEAEEGN